MISRKLIKKQPGRRWLTYAAGLSLLALTLGVAGSALAVHDLVFQLDGNTSTAPGTVPDPTVQVKDWESLFNADGSPKALIDTTAATGFNAGSFNRDFQSKDGRNGTCSLSSAGTTFCTADATTYATGSKDTLDIPGWQCNKDNNVNSKIDIMNAYAAQYVDPGTSDRILYFGLDKNKDNGNNNVAFWFLRGQASCVSTGAAVTFTGTHRDGDVLVVSAFTNGGGVSNIDAYRWDGVHGCIDNPLNAGNCDGLAIGSGGDCKIAPLLDSICATTNSGPNVINTNITTTWLTSDATLGVGHTVVPPDFFEGGINLTEVFKNVGGAPSCFSTFIADTRSSQSLTATLFDFAKGQLGNCSTTLRTSAALAANGASIGGGTVSSGTDTATLTINGTPSWGGTLTWYLCGPVASDGCTNAGVQLGSHIVSQASLPAAFISDSATLTSAGRYCWTAHFEPDADTAAAGVEAADDNGANECFTVTPVTPSLTTTAGDDVVLGTAVTDTAVLSGAATEPGTNGGNATYGSINATDLSYAGTIQFTLKGPSTSGCGSNATGTGTNPQTVNVDTTIGNKTYGPVNFTPDKVGAFHWTATYTNANSANNGSPVTDNGSCDQSREDVTVTGSAAFTTAQNWLPNDSATITAPAGTTLNGTLTFTLYNNATCTPGAGNINQEYTQSFTISGGDPTGVTKTTTNGAVPATTFLATGSGSFSWLVSYVDDHLNNPADSCKEDTTLTIDNTTPPGP